jgi:hypothetical protein
MLANLQSDEVEEALDDYERFAKTDGLIDVLENAREAADYLKIAIVQYESSGGKNSSTFYSSRHDGSGFGTRLKLPKYTLPKFKGDPMLWTSFWEAFEAAVDNQPISDLQKLTYLTGCLDGDANKAVQGYALTGSNYSLVVEHLKKRYGDEELLSKAFHSELINLPSPGNSIEALRRFSESVERICRQLEHMGQSDDNEVVTMTIMSKLPPWLITKLVEREEDYNTRANSAHSTLGSNGLPKRKWGTTQLRLDLQEIISLKERVQRTLSNVKPKMLEGEKDSKPRNTKDHPTGRVKSSDDDHHKGRAFGITKANNPNSQAPKKEANESSKQANFRRPSNGSREVQPEPTRPTPDALRFLR